MSLRRELTFRGKGILNKFELVLAFQKLQREDNYNQLAWRVIKVPKGDSPAGSVVFEPQLGLTTATIVDGIVTGLGHLKEVRLGQRVELKGSGEDLDWQNVTNLGADDQSDIWFDNYSDKKQDVSIVLIEPKGPPAPILVTTAAMGSLAKATFKPALSAYPTQTFKGGQLTIKINSEIKSFQEVDLTKLDETTNYVITEDANTGVYTITADK